MVFEAYSKQLMLIRFGRRNMVTNKEIWAERIYLILGGIFIASLVASNMIFQKFLSDMKTNKKNKRPIFLPVN